MSTIITSSHAMNQHHSEIWKYAVITIGDIKYDTENIGFVLNQAVANINHNQISQLYDLKHTLPKCQIYCGGPVATDKCTFLHSTEYSNSNTQHFNNQCSISFNDQIVADINAGKGPKYWKVMLGLSQWQPGQLDAEIMRPGGWSEHSWSNYAWGNYKRKTKMWERIMTTQSNQQAKMFLKSVFGK